MTTKKRKITGLKRTAYHEAGHAVVAYWLRRSFRTVSIEPNEEHGTLGHMENRKLRGIWEPDVDPEPYRRRFERFAMIYLAGREAERRISRRYNHVGATDDYKNAFNLLTYLTNGDFEEATLYIELLRHRTKRLLLTPYLWAAVETLARQLLVRKTIKGAEAKTIIRQAIEDSYYAPIRNQVLAFTKG